MSFGKKFKEARKAKRLSQSMVAKYIGECTAETISNLERKVSALPTSKHLIKIAAILDISLDYLLEDEICSNKPVNRYDYDSQEFENYCGRPLTSIGETIKYLREYHGLSQKEFAIIIGSDSPSICRWERSIELLRANKSVQISAIFGIPLDKLYESEIKRARNDYIAMKPIGMTFGERLARIRKVRGFTQKDVAEAIGVTYQAISKFEHNNAYPEFKTLVGLAVLFDCSLDKLLESEIELAKITTGIVKGG